MKRIAVGLTVAIILIVCVAAYANHPWYKAFNELYEPKPETVLEKAKCAICHAKPSGMSARNPYGKMLDRKLGAAAALRAVEGNDADKDGVSNIAEIKAGTLPGDPKSRPSRK